MSKPLHLAFAACALALPWLVPIHMQPWTSFHAEMTAAVVFAALALLVWAKSSGCRVPAVSALFALLAALPVGQYLVGMIPFLADAWLACAYLLGLSVAVATGAALHAIDRERTVALILGSFAVASTASLSLALNQWLQLDLWPEWSLSLPDGARVTANVAQANNLATLFAWGLIALWWFQHRRRVHPGLALVAAMLLMLGVVMTRSRVGAIEVLVVLAFVAVHRNGRPLGRHAAAMGALLAWFVGLWLAWDPLNQALGLLPQSGILERLQPGKRPAIWGLILHAIAERPLAGWGWLQLHAAQSTVAADVAAVGVTLSFSHNLVLDLMIWNGVPIGIAITVVLGAWFVSRWRLASSDAAARALMLALTLLLLHAMLELPHGYATFLLPAGLMIGVVEQSMSTGSDRFRALEVPRSVMGLILTLMVVGLGLTIRDYFRVEQAWTAERIRMARIGPQEPQPLPAAPTLDHLLALIQLGRVEPSGGMSAADLSFMEETAHRFPAARNLLRLARAQGLNGQAEQASRTIEVVCRTHPVEVCAAVRASWEQQITN